MKQEGDVLGECPRCLGKVAVYARGGKLRVRAHTRTTNHGTGWHDVACPVTGVDGADALSRVMATKAQGVASADRDVTSAEAALDAARKRAAKARERRDAYAAQVEALKARVAEKGGV